MEFTENAWNSPSSAVEFTKRRGNHGKDVEFTEMAWNSRYGMESAGMVLVVWAVPYVSKNSGFGRRVGVWRLEVSRFYE